MTTTTHRGTTNRNQRGSAEGRRRRRQYLVDTYRANVDADTYLDLGANRQVLGSVPLGEGQPACRCYRCGALLIVETVTSDRIIPGCLGGTYRRENIRPCCVGCNSSTGGSLGNARKQAAVKP